MTGRTVDATGLHPPDRATAERERADGKTADREPAGVDTAGFERVVVAVSGRATDEILLRRAAELTRRELIAVHVARSAGRAEPAAAALSGPRALAEALGASYRVVVGPDVAQALLDFTDAIGATQLVLGAGSRRASSTGATVLRGAHIDVHLVGPARPRRDAGVLRALFIVVLGLRGGLSRQRQLAGAGTAFVLLGLVTAVCVGLRDTLGLAGDVPIYLLVVIVTALVGGFLPALAVAVVGSLALNYFFVPPIHTFTIDRPENILALVIFLVAAVLVSRVVDLAARRESDAARSGAEAETLLALATSMLRGETAPAALLQRVRETFGMRGASLFRRDGDAWLTIAQAGAQPPGDPAAADAVAVVDEQTMIALTGRRLPGEDQRVLSAFAIQIGVGLRQIELAEAARAIEPLVEEERQRTTLLNAVSHDLRTPIASAKAAVAGLRSRDVVWSDTDRDELLATADTELDRLTDLVTNLLDLSRLQAGVLPVLLAPVGLDDVVARALDHVADGVAVTVDVPASLPEVRADAGLLERVVANVVQNALRFAPPDVPVEVRAATAGDRIELRVIDRGPGIPADAAVEVFNAFQRRDDTRAHGAGLGLGLAIARGFTEAMGGSVRADATPGGGATLVVVLCADRHEVDRAEVDGFEVDRPDVDRSEVDRSEVDRPDVDRAEVGDVAP